MLQNGNDPLSCGDAVGRPHGATRPVTDLQSEFENTLTPIKATSRLDRGGLPWEP
jgi:hypothetical protein